ncbi:MAG: zinc-dependent alcohol dehydrogenase family protein [Gammaproteobacteria bacterium]|nr:zinc-dependent alcohol dehydrogenase family protein [Gammaproteobacteria bacterium]
MRACVLERSGEPLRLVDRPPLAAGPGQLRLAVQACAVCRTDLHLVDGELPAARLPVIPGHEIVARVLEAGPRAGAWRVGDRVGVAWLGWACGECEACRRGAENLCPQARYTGCNLDGGFATEALVDARFAVAIPDRYGDIEAAPLLCAGLIGWRALQAAGAAACIGLYGFGAAAHIIAQVARLRGQEVHAFVRPGDGAAAEFARSLGVAWAGDSTQSPPRPLDAALIFAPIGELVPLALRAVRPGGTVVCAGIHMSPLPAMPYEILWGERVLRSVANLTRRDALEFFAFAARHPIRTCTTCYALEAANGALADLRSGRISGAAVLLPQGPVKT